MIQRIQSVLLALVFGTMVAVFFFPIWNEVDTEKSEELRLSALVLLHEKTDIDTAEVFVIADTPTFYIGILAALAALVAVFSIFKYNNRLLQMKLGALNSLLMGSAMGVAIYFIWTAETELLPAQGGNYLVGFYLFVGGLLCNSLANRFIRKDENLVRSADRIR